jgi:predicted PurR-regulated permease PerM
MPPRLRRAIVLLLLGAGALYIGFWLVGRLRSLIVMLLVSLFLAFAMEPAANYLARRGWRRGVATATVFAVLVGVPNPLALGIWVGWCPSSCPASAPTWRAPYRC